VNVFEYTFTSISDASMPLRMWQGQPLLIVNTACQCSYNNQFRELQQVFREYREGGLVVIGIPCNDFGDLEPWDEDLIAHFCESNYGVQFPMTNKQHVIGGEAHPLYDTLVQSYGVNMAPKWNFQKYLFDRAGELIDTWPSAVTPTDPLITHNIERNLNSWLI
jgi:glutathione peroxidase